jgi:serine/threonine protein phosphatase PrpC
MLRKIKCKDHRSAASGHRQQPDAATVTEVNKMATILTNDNRTLQLEAAALTDRGQKRPLNEDAVFHQTGRTHAGQSIGLYMVCDGLGERKTGEVASRLAVETVAAELADLFSPAGTPPDNDHPRPTKATLTQQIKAAVTKANMTIRHYAKRHRQAAGKLGTTITMALIYANRVHIANVGDSRAYVWRAGWLTQLSQDHSLAGALARWGEIDERQLRSHPQRKVLLQALGLRDQVKVELFDWTLEPGDKLLLCSDGLWNAFADTDALASWLSLEETPSDLCWRLVLEAKQRDGSDNISAVVVTADRSPKEQHRALRTRLAGLFSELALTW